MAAITLRTYVFLDNMQDQLAGFIGTTARGYLPVGGVAALFIETAPGIMVVERSFGLLEVHHKDQGQVLLAGKAILDYLGLSEGDRLKPSVVSEELIRGVEPYHAQMLNNSRSCAPRASSPRRGALLRARGSGRPCAAGREGSGP